MPGAGKEILFARISHKLYVIISLPTWKLFFSVASRIKWRNIAPQFIVPARRDFISIVGAM
jgi:hypothetical protein